MIFQDGRPLIYDSGNYPAQLDMIKDMIGWDGSRPSSRAAQQGRLLGIGLGCYVEGTGPGPYEGAHIQVLTDGSVEVAIGLTSQGQGHQTVFAQIVADELGVPFESVQVTTGDTRRFGYAVGTFASRAAVMSGSAVALAARAVRAKALRVASDALECAATDLEIMRGRRGQGQSDRVDPVGSGGRLSNPLRYAFDEAAKAATQFARPADPNTSPVAEGESPGLESSDYYSPPRSTFASGMHAAIIEIDDDTSEITINRYCVVHDCGTLINPMIVRGQVHGGVVQGIAGALYETLAYDEHGQLLNASFMDFLMPYVTEVPPRFEIGHQVTPSPLNPLGIKGAGEAGVIPVSAVIAAAVEDAMGFHIDAMPLNPSRLFDLRRDFDAGRLEPLKGRPG